ncbi:MAG: hypothetical protein VXZ49_02565, partial [Planctomycetota bacterium]|nr:hypothetical protein [Planctomycetota bacterium]
MLRLSDSIEGMARAEVYCGVCEAQRETKVPITIPFSSLKTAAWSQHDAMLSELCCGTRRDGQHSFRS